MLDDFGYNDLGANGNPSAPTPVLDALAAEGIRYTRHYADATCAVARAALLTSRLPATWGLRPVHLGLSSDTPTLASALGSAGYKTRHIGKWHVVNATLAQSPSELGFDSWFGFLFQSELGGASEDGISYPRISYFDPWLRDGQSEPQQHRGHLTDILTNKALDFLEAQRGSRRPWFLNLWYFSPHAPIEPHPAFQKQFPATPEGRYHAMINHVDTRIGEVLRALSRNDMHENTLVVLVSDNGGTNRETDNNSPFFGKKAQFTEGGLRTPLLLRWPGRIPPGTVSDELVSIVDIFPTLANAAGAEIPSEAIGRDLLAAVPRPTLKLYWEYANSRWYRYSILSEDGRWRLTDSAGTEPILNDLEANPSGEENVADRYPKVISRLRRDYLAWRHRARIVDYEYQLLSSNGRAILRGRDLLRSPGHAGFTLSWAVTPDAKDDEPWDQVLLEQEGRWRIHTDRSGGLQIRLPGHNLRTPPLARGECSHVIVTSHFNFSALNPVANWSVANVYVDGLEVDSSLIEHPRPVNAGYANPTYLGSDARGERPFKGTLGQPLILNERVVNDRRAGDLKNGISDILDPCTNGRGQISKVRLW